MTRPNILFAFADDWGRYASIYADKKGASPLCKLIDTPNFDKVADEGVVFTNALVPAPTCTPCRSSVLSGRYFWQTGLGAILRGAVWDERIPSYPLMLEESGYHIGFTYKVWGPGYPDNQPYGGVAKSHNSAGTRFNSFSFEVTNALKDKSLDSAKQEMYDEVRGNFEEFLSGNDSGKPWCYWWGPTNTHREWQRGSGKQLWDINPDDLKGKLPDFLPDVHEIREDVADYLGECMAYDGGLGVLLNILEQRGELDNTLIVVSGDHGIPGFPRAKCNLYDIGCEVALAARLPGVIPGGRVVEDMVNIMDLAPTFLEAGGLTPHPKMAGCSLMPIFTSTASGQVDPQRTAVFTGRERHVESARQWSLPYPQRAIRTHDYLYIRNFAPDRWPMGDPKGLDDPATIPPAFEELEHNTRAAYADLDAGPTKAWMIYNRGDEAIRDVYKLGFGKRPGEELYDLRNDPHHMNNLAGREEYLRVQNQLSERLMQELTTQLDPRLIEEDCRFEKTPFTDAEFPDQDAQKRLAMVPLF